MNENLQGVFILFGVGLAMCFILAAGYMIGSAVAYSTQADRTFQLHCVDQGAHIEYVTNVGTVCKK